MAFRLTLKPHTSGDTWPGIRFSGIASPDAPLGTLTAARLRLQRQGQVGQEWTMTSGLTVHSAVEPFDVEVPAQVLTLPAGIYEAKFKITTSSGLVDTLFYWAFDVRPE